MQEIYSRRSCRNYIEKEISNDDIKSIIKAGMNAPSSFNSEPWNFIIVKNKNILTELSIKKEYAAFLKECDQAIILVAKLGSPFYQQDMAACMQNMMLKATNLNIGTCWIGLDKNKNETKIISNIFKINEDYEAYAILSLGYPKFIKKDNDKYDESKIKYEIWK